MSRRNQENELYFVRSIFSALRDEVYALIDENRDGDRSAMVAYSPAFKIGKNEWVLCAVVANMDRKVTVPYVELFTAKDADVEATTKKIANELVSKPRNSIFAQVANTDSAVKSFRNKVIKIFGSISDDMTPNIADCFDDIKSVSVFKIFAQIVKDTIEDLDDIIENEIAIEDYDNFNEFVGRYKNENISVRKDKRKFNFHNGLVFTVVGFDYDDEDETCSYKYLVADVGYSIKREAKADDMYN